jgi:hypothetical protein
MIDFGFVVRITELEEKRDARHANSPRVQKQRYRSA